MAENKNKVEQKLTALHGLLCDELTKQLEGMEDEDGHAVPAPPALLNVIRQFLKDNSIDGFADNDSPLADLIDELPEEFKQAFNSSVAQ